LIELLPPKKKITFYGDDVNYILIQIELQGGNRKYVHNVNKRLEEVIDRCDMK
jgi:hypothetical protein